MVDVLLKSSGVPIDQYSYPIFVTFRPISGMHRPQTRMDAGGWLKNEM